MALGIVGVGDVDGFELNVRSRMTISSRQLNPSRAFAAVSEGHRGGEGGMSRPLLNSVAVEFSYTARSWRSTKISDDSSGHVV
jgi:hypothetical protein